MTAQVRAAALLAGVDAHYAREQKAADQLESARRIAVALESRLAEVWDFLDSCGCSSTSDRTCPGCRALRLLSSELTADA